MATLAIVKFRNESKKYDNISRESLPYQFGMQFVNKFGLRVEYNHDEQKIDLYTKTSGIKEGVPVELVIIFVVAFSALGVFVYVAYQLKIRRLVREKSSFMKIYNSIYKDQEQSADTQSLRDAALRQIDQ